MVATCMYLLLLIKESSVFLYLTTRCHYDRRNEEEGFDHYFLFFRGHNPRLILICRWIQINPFGGVQSRYCLNAKVASLGVGLVCVAPPNPKTTANQERNSPFDMWSSSKTQMVTYSEYLSFVVNPRITDSVRYLLLIRYEPILGITTRPTLFLLDLAVVGVCFSITLVAIDKLFFSIS